MSMFFFFFFNDTATTEIYTLSLHDALPIFCLEFACNKTQNFAFWLRPRLFSASLAEKRCGLTHWASSFFCKIGRAHSELQSRQYLVCRLLLEKKKKTYNQNFVDTL